VRRTVPRSVGLAWWKEKKGAKNVKTLWREAEKLIGADGALQMVDPLT
jgi:hypothetical protein